MLPLGGLGTAAVLPSGGLGGASLRQVLPAVLPSGGLGTAAELPFGRPRWGGTNCTSLAAELLSGGLGTAVWWELLRVSELGRAVEASELSKERLRVAFGRGFSGLVADSCVRTALGYMVAWGGGSQRCFRAASGLISGCLSCRWNCVWASRTGWRRGSSRLFWCRDFSRGLLNGCSQMRACMLCTRL